VDGFEGTWSLLLPPDYRQCRARPLEDIAAFQWECTNRVILEDLKALDPGRWISLSYSDLIGNPAASLKRILKFVELDIDSTLEQHSCASPAAFPLYRYRAGGGQMAYERARNITRPVIS